MIYVNPVLVLRILQGILALIAMSLGATVANAFNTSSSPVSVSVPSAIAFFIFTSVFTMLLTVPYTIITPRYFPLLAHPLAMLSAETATCVLWLGGFAAVADLLRRKAFVVVSNSTSAATGCVVVGVFEFILFGVTAFFAFSHVFLGDRFSVRKNKNLEKPQTHRSWLGAEVV